VGSDVRAQRMEGVRIRGRIEGRVEERETQTIERENLFRTEVPEVAGPTVLEKKEPPAANTH